MKKCTKYLIIVNETKDVDLKWSGFTYDALKAKGFEVNMYVGLESEGVEGYLKDTDVIIVMGGDGTILRVAHILAGRQIPVIGVNLGTVGFLTEVGVTQISSMIERLSNGDYELEERMMLSGRVHLNGTSSEGTSSDGTSSDGVSEDATSEKGKCIDIQALNEIVLARDNALRIIALRILVNGRHFDTCEADGIMIATPTGSTGYNLSAGGPIVQPDARLMVMTPISPYSLSRRSVIFGADDHITLELLQKRKDAPSKGLLSHDGEESISMEVGDTVEIEPSKDKLLLVKLDESSLYEILTRKLGN